MVDSAQTAVVPVDDDDDLLDPHSLRGSGYQDKRPKLESSSRNPDDLLDDMLARRRMEETPPWVLSLQNSIETQFGAINANMASMSSCLCTSYSLKPTTIPLAPPLVEVNGEVLKTLADRTVPFCTDGRSLYRPRRNLPHLSWAISLSGWIGWALKTCPPFQGVFIRNGHGKTMRFKTSSCRTCRNYSSYKNTFDVFATKREGR